MNSAICVTGLGVVSSLGLEWRRACAAARAGVTRPATLGFPVVDPDTADVEETFGHPLPLGTRGFEGTGRLLRIAQLAYRDFSRSVDLASLDASRCGFLVALPGSARSTSSMAIEGVDEENGYVNPRVTPDLSHPGPDEWLAHLGRVTRFEACEKRGEVVHAGHAGLAVALEKAIDRLQSRQWCACVIAAIDSLVEPATLQWLNDHGRLKCSSNQCASSWAGST